MKVVDLSSRTPGVSEIVAAAQHEDLLLVRDGHALARLEKFHDQDWSDWQYEHSREAIERGRRARQQYACGQFTTLEQMRSPSSLVKEAPASYGRRPGAKRAASKRASGR